jgi:O-antigen ligase
MNSQAFAVNSIKNDAVKSEKLRFILVMLFVFCLPFDRFYSNIILMLLALTTLIDLSASKFKAIPEQIWLFQLVFFLACMGYFFSYNKHEAGFMLEKQLTILLFPFILPLAITITNERIDVILRTLTLTCILSVLYLFSNVFYIIHLGGLPLNSMFSKEFFNHNFSAPLAIHAGYLSLYIAFSIIYLAKVFINQEDLFKKIAVLMCLSILFAGLFFLASRNIIIVTALILCFVFPLYFINQKLLFFTSVIILLSVSLLTFSRIDYLKNRFSTDFVTEITLVDNASKEYVGVEPRAQRWKAAMELVEESPLFGYGTGDEILMLKAKYMKKGFYISYLESFNAHNQYLSYLLKNGIVGLLIFMFAFGYYFWLAIKSKSYVFVSFLILLLIGFLTENILDANKGIFFFAFFNTFLGYCALNQRKKDANKLKITQPT